MTPGDSKSEKIESKGDQKLPQGHQKWTNGRQKGVKGNQHWAKGRQKGSKRAPNCDKFRYTSTWKGRVSEKVGNSGCRPAPRPSIFEQLSINNQWTNRCESRCWKSHELWWHFDARMNRIFDFVRKVRSWKNVLFEKSECTETICSIRVGEVSLHYQVARNLYTIDKKSMQSRCA